MENLYAIYSYQLVKTNDEGDWTQGVEVQATDITAAQDRRNHQRYCQYPC